MKSVVSKTLVHFVPGYVYSSPSHGHSSRETYEKSFLWSAESCWSWGTLITILKLWHTSNLIFFNLILALDWSLLVCNHWNMFGIYCVSRRFLYKGIIDSIILLSISYTDHLLNYSLLLCLQFSSSWKHFIGLWRIELTMWV